MRRRRLLASVGPLAVLAAGCTDDADTGAEADEADTDAGTEGEKVSSSEKDPHGSDGGGADGGRD